MDGWRIQQQQQQQRMAAGGVGPVAAYHPMRSRSSPYPSAHQLAEMQHSYSYSQTQSSGTPLADQSLSPIPLATTPGLSTTPNPMANTTPVPTKNDAKDPTTSTDELNSVSSDVYSTNAIEGGYTPAQMQQIQQQQQQQQRLIAAKTAAGGPITGYHPGQQQMMAARARSMPYSMPPQHHHPSMYASHPHTHQGPVCQCAQHMNPGNGHYPPQHIHPSQHSMYYQQQQQQQQAWYQYQHQQAAWRQHQLQQMQNHHHHHHQSQPMPIEQNHNNILSETTTTGGKIKTTKSKAKKKATTAVPTLNDESMMKYPQSSLPMPVHRLGGQPPTSYYPPTYPTPASYTPPQQLPPQISHQSDHPMFAQTSPTLSQQTSYQTHHQPQIFTSPLSNPGTPHQMHNGAGEYSTTTAEFGVPYQHGAPGSVNSLTDALCPGDTNDRQMTPGPPSVGTPRVAPHQYSFPHTPLTPQTNNQITNPHTPSMMPPTPNPLSAPPTPLARPRSSGDQTQSSFSSYFQPYEQMTTTSIKSMSNIDDLAAYLKDPTNHNFPDDLTSSLFDDIDALADTYLGQQSNGQQTSNSADELLLNFLCSDDLPSTVCTS